MSDVDSFGCVNFPKVLSPLRCCGLLGGGIRKGLVEEVSERVIMNRQLNLKFLNMITSKISTNVSGDIHIDSGSD